MPEAFCLNGDVTVGSPPTVSVLDHGFLYGDGLFETMRATDGEPYLLERHLARLRDAAEVLGLPPPPEAELRRWIAATVHASGEPDAYVRLTVTRGPGAAGPDPRTCPQSTAVVVVRAFPGLPARWSEQGLAAITASIRRNEHSPLSQLKSCNYLDCILAKEEARAAGADEALMLNGAGNVAEAAAWNVFAVCEGLLRTPPPNEGLLPGVTRTRVLELAAEHRIAAREAPVTPAALREASEAFLTNSLYGLVALTRLDGAPIGAGAPGPVTSRLQALYEEARRCPG